MCTPFTCFVKAFISSLLSIWETWVNKADLLYAISRKLFEGILVPAICLAEGRDADQTELPETHRVLWEIKCQADSRSRRGSVWFNRPEQRAETASAWSSHQSEQPGTEVRRRYKVSILLWLVLANLITGKAPQKSMQRQADAANLKPTLLSKPYNLYLHGGRWVNQRCYRWLWLFSCHLPTSVTYRICDTCYPIYTSSVLNCVASGLQIQRVWTIKLLYVFNYWPPALIIFLTLCVHACLHY